jgi:xylulokinase
MTGKYLAGIDIGTTGSKAAIFDLKGNVLGSAYNEYECSYPKPNWIEQDPAQLVDTAMSAARKAIALSGIDPVKIASAGFSTQRSCAIFIDKSRKPLRPMISWQDSRCTEEIKDITEKISPKEFYDITGFPLNTTWVLPELLWVRKNEPKVWEKVFKLVQLQDFTLMSFGVDGFINDISDAGFSGMYDTNKFDWSDRILKLFEIDKDILPVPTPSGTKVGTISKYASEKSGFLEGMPICVGAGDQNCAATGAGVIYEGYASISMGTAGNANAFLNKPFRDPAGKNMVVNHSIFGKWQIEGHQAGAAGVFRWFRDEIATHEKEQASIANKNVYKILDEHIAKVPAGSKGLVFLPYLASSTAPRWNINARGVLAGLAFGHDKWSLARAFLEGITLEMKDILTSMINSGISIQNIKIMGGATNSPLWNQLQSDIYNMEVATLKVNDAAVLGAAILGGVGVGIFNDIREGVKNMVKIDKSYVPNKANSEIYNELYSIYCNIYESFEEKKVFEAIAKIQNRF